MRGNEWPLIIFTLLMQVTVGIFMALSVVYSQLLVKGSSVIPKEVTGRLFIFILPMMLLAGAAAFFHLGNPKNAYYALSNISDSWLSREILFTIIYSVLACIVSVLVYKEIFSPVARHLLIVVCVACGVVLIFVMSKLYMLETVPAWNSYFTPGSFFLSALILGAISFLSILLYISGRNNVNIFSDAQTEIIIRAMLFSLILFVAAGLGMWLLHLKSLSAGAAASKESFNLVFDKHVFLFAVRIVLSVFSLVLLGYTIYSMYNRSIDGPGLIFITLSLLLVSELVGRYLFYAMYARSGV